ncbi:MAG: DNA translocase FtsK 4TM domain-containing protein [Pseudomonadota bacterium]|nr:DNA translocase FtsK 4TM domain-containing protein [Pseudomonadota bacterium]
MQILSNRDSRTYKNGSASNKVLPAGTLNFFIRRFYEAIGMFLIASGIALATAIITYSSSDNSLNSAGSGNISNLLGLGGAFISDFVLQVFGIASLLPVLIMSVWGWRLVIKKGISLIWLRFLCMLAALITFSYILNLVSIPENWPLISKLGGVLGSFVHENITNLSVLFEFNLIITTAFLSIIAFGLLVFSLGLSMQDWQKIGRLILWLILVLGEGIRQFIFVFRITLEWINSIFYRKQVRTDAENQFDDDINFDPIPVGKQRVIRKEDSQLRNGLVTEKKPRLKTSRKAVSERQGKLNLESNKDYQTPPLDFLNAEQENKITEAINKEALQQNAKFLAGILEDFGVKGEIVKVRPGPVVTLYELDPAPGTKTSRVIGLSDDIARSMSAISVRIAVVPGQSVIGIELPNLNREMVHLGEILSSHSFEKAPGKLPLALGKDIGGSPITLDLAGMPHLLIAGTTGSGKSVAMNTMIMSLLYRLRPDECKFIMIDPKMLELSVYEGIPHLLTPVVTEPSKAIVALKWTVREMEERYRSMSQMGVRNISGYNARLSEATRNGEILTRSVQTGFDEDGKPIMEEQPLEMEQLPFIVVVVDEMADLMMVAGKDVEAAIQRLAQMARAAGIHLLMATQRPSVDVITGTIKANFPTRISFQVTSKIDSRTILGEQGAEQLLGQGDMLCMTGGGRISRIHGPFISDDEVERVVNFLKSQGEPEFIEDITHEEFTEGFSENNKGSSIDDLYDEAVALVAREGKASTSFIQRHLQIGYNRAARIIEEMEKQSVVSSANRVGRREVLIDHHAS